MLSGAAGGCGVLSVGVPGGGRAVGQLCVGSGQPCTAGLGAVAHQPPRLPQLQPQGQQGARTLTEVNGPAGNVELQGQT
jgi:hypothetical protein